MAAILIFRSKAVGPLPWRVSGAAGVRKSPKNEPAVHERGYGDLSNSGWAAVLCNAAISGFDHGIGGLIEASCRRICPASANILPLGSRLFVSNCVYAGVGTSWSAALGGTARTMYKNSLCRVTIPISRLVGVPTGVPGRRGAAPGFR